MIEKVEITVLVDNVAGGRGLLAEHGLALWVEVDGVPILFDTGQGLALEHNARVLGVELERAAAVVLSHGHYDHVGGLAARLTRFGKACVYLHPAAFERKFLPVGEIGMQSASPEIGSVEELRSRVGRVVLTAEPTEVVAGVWVTGQIPRRTAFEDTGGSFYLDEAATQPDPLIDDQALYIECSKGLVVVLGCAHAGVVNTLEHIAEQTGREQIHAVLGGMHLWQASEQRIAETVAALERYDVQVVAAGHCTARHAIERLWAALPGRCVEYRVGSRLTLA